MLAPAVDSSSLPVIIIKTVPPRNVYRSVSQVILDSVRPTININLYSGNNRVKTEGYWYHLPSHFLHWRPQDIWKKYLPSTEKGTGSRVFNVSPNSFFNPGLLMQTKYFPQHEYCQSVDFKPDVFLQL